VRGTAHVLEALKVVKGPVACVVVTSDKCYENQENGRPYRETDPLGGHDVYSMSKGAAELVTSSWRRSFFPIDAIAKHGVRIASARAGNVIGGGDRAADRIVPDAVAALEVGKPVGVRSPKSVRPWQHVLEPVGGYLWLGAKLLGPDAAMFCEAWNFGPDPSATVYVKTLVERLVSAWGSGTWEDHSKPGQVHEAGLLGLSIEKAKAGLGWRPRWDLDAAVVNTVEWYRAQGEGLSAGTLRKLTLQQIASYLPK
jgi:CDP-glucose 4,6-dehydratase